MGASLAVVADGALGQGQAWVVKDQLGITLGWNRGEGIAGEFGDFLRKFLVYLAY